MLAFAVFLSAGPIAAQELEVSETHQGATELYGRPISPAIYLVNFLLLYMVNPRVAANMPAIQGPPFLKRSSLVWNKIHQAALCCL